MSTKQTFKLVNNALNSLIKMFKICLKNKIWNYCYPHIDSKQKTISRHIFKFQKQFFFLKISKGKKNHLESRLTDSQKYFVIFVQPVSVPGKQNKCDITNPFSCSSLSVFQTHWRLLQHLIRMQLSSSLHPLTEDKIYFNIPFL